MEPDRTDGEDLTELDHLRRYLTRAGVVAYQVAPDGGGHPNKFGAVLTGGISVIVKPIAAGDAGSDRMARNEVAASVLAEALGWGDLVACTVLREIPDPSRAVVSASVQVVWANAGDPANETAPARPLFSAYDAERAGVFDHLIGQFDRHGHNWLGIADAQGKMQLRLVDHGHSFGHPQEGVQSEWTDALKGQTLSAEVLKAVQGLDSSTAGALRPLLPTGQLAKTLKRAQELVRDKSIS